jgi:hypothetical protein
MWLRLGFRRLSARHYHNQGGRDWTERRRDPV